METNIGIALFTAATSVGVGGFVSYILYVKTIGKWYSKEKRESTHIKIKYWCGILSLLTITQGVTTIVSALINSLINNVAINVDSVAKGMVVVIIYPILFAVIAFGLVFFIKEKTNKENIQVEEIIKKNIVVENKKTNTSKLVIFLTIAVVLLLAIQVAPYLKINEKEKTFSVESCITCKDDGCKPTNDLIKFRVTPEFVYVHYISDGAEKVNVYPDNSNDLCVIVKEKNFSFHCEKIRDFGMTKLESTNQFDGENTYKTINKATFGEQTITTKSVCQIK